MKYFVIVLVTAVAAAAQVHTNRHKIAGSTRGPGFTRTYSGYQQSGTYIDFTDYVADLYLYNFDNVIRGACQTGLWFYYSEIEYNQNPGSVYWMHGVEYCGDMPLEFADVTSSLRFAGSYVAHNVDSFTLYQGTFFTGNEFYGEADVYTSLSYMDSDASSLVLTGLSPWTFYTGVDNLGTALCVYPNTDHDLGLDGTRLDFGIFPTITELGFPDNAIRSAAKGCFSTNVAKATPMKALHRAKNGAMGILKPRN